MLGSMVTLALPYIGTDFIVSARDLGWMTTVYFLANVICIVPATKIVDKIGYRRSYIFGAFFVAAISLLSVFAPNYPVLLILRVLAGMGTAFTMITGLAILTRVYPKEKRGFVIGINTAVIFAGGTLGPIVGGLLAESVGWNGIFLFITPVMLIAGILLSVFMKEEFKEPVGRFDVRGILLYAAAMFCLMCGLSLLPDVRAIVLTAAGIGLLALFVRAELRTKEPALNMGLFFKNKRFARSAYTTLLNFGAVYGSVYFVSLYLQSVGALNAFEAGLVIVFQPILQMIMTPVAGKLSDSFEPRYLATTGMALTAVGVFLLSLLNIVPFPLYGYIAVTQIFLGLGAALFSAPNTNAIMSAVSKHEFSMASGIVSIMREVGMLFSMAVAMSFVGIIVGGSELIGPAMYAEFAVAMQFSMLVYTGLAVVGILFSWFRGPAPVVE